MWVRDQLIPRLVFIPYWLARLLLALVSLFRRHRSRVEPTMLCIEAGVRGWESIEFKELLQSAGEFLGVESVRRVVVDRDGDYLGQFRQALQTHSPTHYVYDPRSGSQRAATGLWHAMRIAVMMRRRGVTPIVLLTDLSVRKHRAQAAVVTAVSGAVVSFISGRVVAPIFPHRRLVAPSLMPMSEATLDRLLALPGPGNDRSTARFVGSLYEPRTSILAEVGRGLATRGFKLEYRGRQAGGPRMPDDEYWSSLAGAPVLVTTADQVVSGGADWTWVPQVMYRYLEALACGTLLVAPAVPGIHRYLSPGEHFVAFSTPGEAVDVIERYLGEEAERSRIARAGRVRAEALVRARTFWTSVDVALGPESLT